MLAKAVAHHTTAAFIRVVGSEFVQKYLGEVRRTPLRVQVILICRFCNAAGWSAYTEAPWQAIMLTLMQHAEQLADPISISCL